MRGDEVTEQMGGFQVGEWVRVLQAVRLPREVELGTGQVQRITESADGTRLYWVAGFPMARDARVLRLAAADGGLR